jgi:thiamine pyrophosphokinase
MTWPEFLKILSGEESIDILGPMTNSWSPRPHPVLYIDGGIRWKKPGSPAECSLGDGDSGTQDLNHLLPKEKDYSDLSFALQSLPQNLQQLYLHGFLGGRRDHELINFGEVHTFLKSRLKPCHVSWGDEVLSWNRGACKFEWTGLFSLVAFEKTQVTIEGDCEYLLSSKTELGPVSSFGLSNQANGQIVIESEGPVFVFKSI